MRRFLLLVVVPSALWVFAGSRDAEAAGCEDVAEVYQETVAEAQALQKEGKALLDASKALEGEVRQETEAQSKQVHIKAAQTYLKAYALCDRFGSIRYGVGLMYERAGECARAIEYYSSVVADAEDASALESDPQLASVLPRARERLESVEGECSVARLEITCAQEGVELAVDGGVRSACPLSLELTQGKHSVRATLAGHEPREEAITLAPRTTAKLAIPELERSSVSESVAEQKAEPETPESTGPSWISSNATWSTGSTMSPMATGTTLLVLGLGSAGGWGWLRFDTQRRVDDGSLTSVEVEQRENAMGVLLIFGITGVALGTTIITTSLVRKKRSAKKASVLVSPNSITIRASF